MALQTTGDIITEVLVRNNRTTTDSFITDAMLQDWLRDAHSWATSFRKWPFTESRQSTTWSGSQEYSFEGYKADSIRLVTVGDKLMQKINYKDFLQMKDETTDSTQRVFTDYGRTLIVNELADVSGTMVVYGQYKPTIDPTDLTANTLFTNYDDEGNEAIVEKMTSYLKSREHFPEEADFHEKRAQAKLLELWKNCEDEQFNYQVRNGDGMWKRFDILRGGNTENLFKRDQWGNW